MYKVIFFYTMLFIFSCTPDTNADKEETKKSTAIATIDLGIFTGQNYDSQLMRMNIPANWEFELKSISMARQQQLSRDQIKENILPLNDIKQVTLFEAKEKIAEPDARQSMLFSGTVSCLAINLKKQDATDLNQYVEKFRTTMASRIEQTQIAKFNLSPTKEEMFNNIKFKVINSETKYPTIQGAEDIVIKNKILFHQKGNLVYRYSLSYSKPEQLEEIVKIISSIIYKK